jgi:hypothetical protein
MIDLIGDNQSQVSREVISSAHADLVVAMARTAVTITQRRDGGPMRPAGRKRGFRPGGLYASAKTGKMMGWESRPELWGFHHAEVDTAIVAYRAQPHTAEALADGGRLVYTPDREDQLADGRIRIIEVKEQFEADRDPYYARKLEYFAEVYRSLGWEFRLIDAAGLTRQPLFGGVEAVERLRRAAFTSDDLNRVREALADGPRALAELVPLFDSEVLARSLLCAMMVGRYLAIDLSAGFYDGAVVTAL